MILSSFKEDEKSKKYNFVIRNEIVVALGDKLIVTEADIKSGSMTSVNFALQQNKEIFVLPYRINESIGTNELIKKGLAKVIFDIDEFLESILGKNIQKENLDEILEYCKNSPLYDEAILKYPNEILEYELEGKIKIENGKVFII